MRVPLTFSVIFIATAASAQQLPTYNVERWCQTVSRTVGSGSEMIYGGCMDMEQAAYDELKPRWLGLSERLKQWCDQVARATGPGSYSTLQGCVELEQSAASSNATRQFRR
jgi:hypothetical protein